MPLRDNDDPPLRRTPDQKRGQTADTKSADDLRVQPFTDDVFSEYHTRRKEAGAPFGLIAGVVIGVAAVAGIGWYLWNSGALGGGGSGNGVPQLVKADPDPYKVKPENPGGMQVENQDKLVYDRVAKGEAPPRVENLLPAPEEPKAPPKPVAPPPEIAKAESAPPVETAKAEPPPAEPAKPVEPAKEVAKPDPAKTEPTKTEPTKTEPTKTVAPAKADQDDLASLVAAATGGREAATGPINTKPGAAPAAEAPQTQVAAAPPAVSPAAMAGAFQIQLASARSEQGAMGEWSRIVGKNKDTLAGLTPNVARVDLGEKGVFFRLRAGPLKDKAAADSVCSALGAQNVGCIVVKP